MVFKADTNRGAHSGVGYHGLCMFSIDHPLRDESEYMTVKLTEPLEKAKRYCLSMWARVSQKYCTGFEELDGVGLLFTSKPVKVTKGTRHSCSREQYAEPQVLFALPEGFSRHRWNRYAVDYVATGDEQYLTIGNFKNPELKKTKKKADRKPKRGRIYLPDAEAMFHRYYVRVFFDDISVVQLPAGAVCDPEPVQWVRDSVLEDSSVIVEPVIDTPEVGETVVLQNIYFDFDSATLLPESFLELDKLVYLLNRLPTLKILIKGHTDKSGSNEYNLDLSDRRAKSVVDYLVGKGIDETRLSHQGFGEEQPIGDDDAVNRRVEFEVVEL